MLTHFFTVEIVSLAYIIFEDYINKYSENYLSLKIGLKNIKQYFNETHKFKFITKLRKKIA